MVDAETCISFTTASRTCLEDGSWGGREPACRRYCDKGYTPPVHDVVRVEVRPEDLGPTTASAIKVVEMDAPPFGPYLAKKGVDKYLQHRIDVFGHYLVMFTDKCKSKYAR